MLEASASVRNIRKSDYIVAFLIICASGNPLVVLTTKWSAIILALLMLLMCYYNKKALVNYKLIKLLFGFTLLFSFQKLLLTDTSLPAEINFLAKLYAVFLASNFLGAKFRYTYFKVIYWISLLSLVCFALNSLGLTFGINFDRYRSIFLYNNIIEIDSIRNSGMFWEPGAFQGYIILVFLLYLKEWKPFWTKHKKECIILSVALLTTLSTTGYLVFCCYIIYILFVSKINKLIKVSFLLILLIACTYAYSNIDFLGEKIEEQYENAQDLSAGDVSWTRMGALMIDIQHIKKHPMIGNGFVMASRYGVLGNKMHGSGNGFTGAINMFGIPCILIYLILVYRNLNFTNLQKIFFVSIIIILLNGEFFLNYPLFWGLIFINIPQSTFALRRNQ